MGGPTNRPRMAADAPGSPRHAHQNPDGRRLAQNGPPGARAAIRGTWSGQGVPEPDRVSDYPQAGVGGHPVIQRRERANKVSGYPPAPAGGLSSYPRADRVPGYPQAEKAGIRLSTGGIPARIPVIQGTPPAEMDSLDKRISKNFPVSKFQKKNLLIHLSTYPDPRICAQKGPFSWIACQNSSLSRVSTAGPEKQPQKSLSLYIRESRKIYFDNIKILPSRGEAGGS